MTDERSKPLAGVPDAGWSQKQRVTSTCTFCGESVEALVPDAVAWFAEHRRAKHPHIPEPEGRGRNASKTHIVGRGKSPRR